MYYVKKPIPVAAKKFLKLGDHPAVKQLGDKYYLPTLEGNMDVTPGSWILGPGLRDEYWVVQDDIFEKSYEPAKFFEEG
jgi:hypothetical protein